MALAVADLEPVGRPLEGRWPEVRPTGLSGLSRFWAVRSLSLSAFGAALDIAVMVALVHFLRWDPVFATAFGVAAGGALNFLLNKHFVFHDRDPRIGLQALRYATATGLAFVLYEGVFYTLIQEFSVHYILAKVLADLLVFTGAALLLNRYVVFPNRRMVARQAIRTIACFALGFAFTGSPALSAGQHFAQSALMAQTSGPQHHDAPVQISNPVANACQPLAARARSVLDGPVLEVVSRFQPADLRLPREPALEPPRRPPRPTV